MENEGTKISSVAFLVQYYILERLSINLVPGKPY